MIMCRDMHSDLRKISCTNAKVLIYFLISKKIRKNLLFILIYLYYSSILEGFAIHRLNCFLAKRNPSFVLPLDRTLVQSINERAFNGFYAHETSAFINQT